MFYQQFINNEDLNIRLQNLIYENAIRKRHLNLKSIRKDVNSKMNALIKEIHNIQEYHKQVQEQLKKDENEFERGKLEVISTIDNANIDNADKEFYIEQVNEVDFEKDYQNNIMDFRKDMVKLLYQAHGIHSGHLGFIGGKKRRKSHKNKTKTPNKTRKNKEISETQKIKVNVKISCYLFNKKLL